MNLFLERLYSLLDGPADPVTHVSTDTEISLTSSEGLGEQILIDARKALQKAKTSAQVGIIASLANNIRHEDTN